MSVIIAQAELVRQEVEGDLRDRIDLLLARADDLVDLADTQREIARQFTSPQDSLTVDVTDLISRSVERVSQTHETATVTVVPLDEGERPLSVPCTLEQAIEELLENAIEHTDRDSPTVTVTLTASRETLDICIADDGPGIPEHERLLLTEDDVESSLAHTSGMGLWLVKWLVTQAGGTLSFETNDPRGSVVRIRLPRQSDEFAVTDPDSSSEPR